MPALSVAILGASANPERYAHRALKSLQTHGHTPLPVHPALKEIEGLPVFSALSKLPRPVHTLTVYVRPEISTPLAEEILSLHPARVIFNPGTENPALKEVLQKAGIQVEEACTLVMLSIGNFE